ncbi:MAG: preprotein translocase subunit SecA [Candidatus Paceibacterota bacterium]|nr:MAG: preprotein translocase subunit SecA [Candidatus Paceibacterota bacterium]
MSLFSRIFGDANERAIRALSPLVAQVNALEEEMQALSDADLRAKTSEFRARLANGATLEDLMPEAFAAVREASRRTLNKRHFDVQIMGGAVLHKGAIAEMRTGEGKTLVATLPTYLNALEGKGAHVVTVNDYLSRRDAVWMGQIYDALGMTVGCINHDASYQYDATHQSTKAESGDAADEARDVTGGFRVVHEFLRPVERKEAYAADITYGTNNEYGFDYLRDNMAYRAEDMVQRGHHFALVDEVDSILIDEARTPLIISAPDQESTQLYETFARIVPELQQESDFTIDEKLKAVSITEAGIEKVEKRLGIGNIYDEGGVRYVHHLEEALRAHVFFKRDRDYVIREGEIVIVDEFTGRLMPGRRWSGGLHQAVEAKEGVRIQKEQRTLATVTFQNYFRLYTKLSGMTGTARTSGEEFHKVYSLDVISVPTHRPMIRADQPDRVYKTEAGKFRAVVREVRERIAQGQPVLIGTSSIQKNELMDQLLTQEGIPHNTLNAKNHEKEAEIIAQAGKSGAVTVATNLAGRGVDILLGGNPPTPEDAEKVRTAGGLHVIGTERHDSRRVDDQLRGRAGRQGDPGSSQFFVSLDDELVRIFAGDRVKNLLERLGLGEDDVIEHSMLTSAIAQAQTRVEGHHFDSRKYVLEYDDVMNKHREAIYGLRRKALMGEDLASYVRDAIQEAIDAMVRTHMSVETGAWDTKQIAESFAALVPGASVQKALEEKSESGSPEDVIAFLSEEAARAYALKEEKIGADSMRQVERMVLLRTIDTLWMDHLELMEHLRDSVRLRAYGQREPLVEYKLEAQRMFNELLAGVRGQLAHVIYKVEVTQQPRPTPMQETMTLQKGQEAVASPSTQSAQGSVGRNDPCPCGSGKKYKKCHGA